jgi:hypothetical protein
MVDHFHSPESVERNTNAANYGLKWRRIESGRNLSRLSSGSLMAGRYRPPCRDEDIRPQPARTGRIGSVQTALCRIRHLVPPCPITSAFPRWCVPHSKILDRVRPRLSLVSYLVSHPCKTRNVFYSYSNCLRVLLATCLPGSFWAIASRPLIEESRLRFHLLNSVGEPGGGVEK